MTDFFARVGASLGGALRRVLLGFRNLVANLLFDTVLLLVYQGYLLLTVGPGIRSFRLNEAALWLLALFAGMDLLLYLLYRLAHCNAQLLFAAGLLLSSGFAAQTVFHVKCFGWTPGQLPAKAAIFLAVGIAAATGCFFVCRFLAKTRFRRLFAKLLFLALMAAACGMLVLSLRGTQWLMGGSVQPGEFVKFGFLFFIAYIASIEDTEMSYLRKFAYIFTTYVVLALTYVLQSELGSLLVITAVFCLFLLVYNNSWRLTGILALLSVLIVGIALAVVIHYGNLYVETYYASGEDGANYFDRYGNDLISKIGYHFGANYKKVYLRFMVCFNIDAGTSATTDTMRTALTDAAYQAKKAFEAVGISGFFTSAPFFRYVPIGQSDYIYTSLIQTGGYLSILVLLFAYLVLIDTTLSSILRNCSLFSRFSAFVMLASLVLQMCINVLGTNNVIPLTGITIPFVSYGGSSLVISCAMLAVLLLPDWLYTRDKRLSRRDAKRTGGIPIASLADTAVQCA